jgi:F-type H+-transporting ATPase subunit b
MKRLMIVGILAVLAAPAFADLSPSPESPVQRTPTADSDKGPHGETEKREPADPTEHFNYFNFSYRGKDEYGGALGDSREGPTGTEYDEEEPMSAPFVLALVNFALFLFILAKYGGPAAKQLASERHDQIKNALDEAGQLRAEAETKLADYDKRISGLDAEIATLVAGIRADAEADKARILAAAETQAATMKRDAEQRIAAEIEYARAALRSEVTAAAAKATEQLLRDKLQPADQEKLVNTFIGDVQQQASRAGTEAKS